MENPERVTYFAATDSRGKYVPFGIKSKDRDRHMYVIGKTGMGKSTLLENMAIQDIRNGEGLAFIDPHGGTIDRLLDFIPENRIKDVVYFAPFDLAHPVAFNVMEDVGYDRRHLVVSGLMATFKKIWEDAWSARMEYILTNTLLALLEYPDATLLGVNRMYTDKDYRKKVVDNVKDPVVKDFWTKEFANYGDRYTQEATPAIQNKVGQFTGNPLIRNIIGQPKSSFDIRAMMDDRKILLINLSKGLIGETNMRLLGSMFTTRIFLSAMSRANLHASELKQMPHFYFYVDEFQNFANQTFAEILSESRKYKLNLVIAHQYIEQMEEEVRDAVFGNVGTTAVFRVGPLDAEVLEPIFMPRFTKEDIASLDRRQMYLTLMIDGVGSQPFSAVSIPPIETPPVSYRERVIEESRQRFSMPRAQIEQAIMEELTESLESEAPQDARMRRRPPQGNRPQRDDRPQRFPDQRVPHRPQPQRFSEERQREKQSYEEPRRDQRPHESRAIEPRESQPREQRPDQRSANQSPARDEVRQTRSEDAQQARPSQRPQQPAKSAADLRTILRTMTEKHNAVRAEASAKRETSIKSAIDQVAPKTAASAVPVPRASQTLQPPVAQDRAEVPVPQQSGLDRKQPYEVPEDDLRRVLKGET